MNTRWPQLYRVATALVAWFVALTAATAARADVYIIANAANPQTALTQKEAVDLFMGRQRAFANGDFAMVFDLPRNNAVRDGFYQQMTGMNPSQVNSYWARLMFTGQTMPPHALPDEKAVLEMVRRNPSAIGYLSSAPTDKGVRTLYVVRERAPAD
jgi:hypothetical protein